MFFKKSTQLFKSVLAVSGLSITPFSVQAALPTVEDPSRGSGSGIIDTMKNYSYDIIVFGGLLVAALAFMVVAWHAVSVFGEVQNGKRKWADFALVCGVGVLLLVVCIWLLTKAAEIL